MYEDVSPKKKVLSSVRSNAEFTLASYLFELITGNFSRQRCNYTTTVMVLIIIPSHHDTGMLNNLYSYSITVPRLLECQSISQKARQEVKNAVLMPTLLYGSEAWLCQKKHVSKVNAVEMRSLRKLCGVTLTNRIRNEEIRRMAGFQESVRHQDA